VALVLNAKNAPADSWGVLLLQSQRCSSVGRAPSVTAGREALTGTGLFALPFLLLAFQAWREAKESAAAGAAAVGLSESIQVKIIIAIFVFTFCYATTPFTTVANLSYTPVSTAVYPNAQTATAGNTNTTYDQATPQVGSISNTGSLDAVPMWWYLVVHGSDGGFIGYQRFERQRLLAGDTGHHDAKRIGYGQTYRCQHDRRLFLDVPVNAGPNNSVCGHGVTFSFCELQCSTHERHVQTLFVFFMKSSWIMFVLHNTT
jgi:hypothetical protein